MKNLINGLTILLAVSILAACAPQKGDTGAPGANGSDGKQGPVGNTGPQGAPGPRGVDGKTITVVQLCPNSTAHYPNVFVEEAFCIDNKLYAVYSADEAFLTVLTPGAYRSDAIGSACNFTVTLNSCVLKY